MIYLNGEEFKINDQLGSDKKKVIFLLHASQYSGKYIKRNDSVSLIKSTPGNLTIPTFYSSNVLNGVDSEVRYVLNSKLQRIGSGTQKVYGPNEIEFVNGKLEVPASKQDLIWWLRNHPNNETNEIYKDGEVSRPKQFIFREKNIKVEKEEAYDNIKAETDTKHYIFSLNKKDTKELYEGIPGLDDDFEDIGVNGAKVAITEYAQRIGYKKFDNYVESQRFVFDSIIKRAIDNDIIAFTKGDKRDCWQWVGGRQFTTVPKGKDEMDHLYVTVMKKDSTGLLNEIKERVEELEK